MREDNSINQLVQSAALYWHYYSRQHSPLQQIHYQSLLHALGRLTVRSLVGDDPLPDSGIGARDLIAGKGLRITVYYLPKGERMQLHNHPKMMVMGYMVKGQAQVQLYSPTRTKKVFERETMKWCSGGVNLIDGLRTTRRNLHQFIATKDCLLVDILFPDYNQQDRVCKFYRPIEEISAGLFRLQQVQMEEKQIFHL